jgi:hypothetical protein
MWLEHGGHPGPGSCMPARLSRSHGGRAGESQRPSAGSALLASVANGPVSQAWLREYDAERNARGRALTVRVKG